MHIHRCSYDVEMKFHVFRLNLLWVETVVMSRYIGEVLCVVMRPMLVDAAVLQRCREAFEDRSGCDIDVYKSL